MKPETPKRAMQRTLQACWPCAKIFALGLSIALISNCASAVGLTPFEDDMIDEAAVIAVIEVNDSQFVKTPGTVLTNGKAWDTMLVVYSARLITRIKGEIPDTPFVAQFTESGDLNLFEKGRHLVFLREAGGIYFPTTNGFKVSGGKLNWYKQVFRNGDSGPYFEEASVEKAISDIQKIMNEKKRPRNTQKPQ